MLQLPVATFQLENKKNCSSFALSLVNPPPPPPSNPVYLSYLMRNLHLAVKVSHDSRRDLKDKMQREQKGASHQA